jgi:SAM-dependent methyltransferase
MHPGALKNAALFFETYAPAFAEGTVVEIGSQDVNGSLRSVCPAHLKYIGLDMVPGKGVDIVITDPYRLPLADASVDIVVASSCFEHSQMFWLLFLEVLRVLKPAGLFYLNVPSNGPFHRYPVDCWRFYPDAGGALVEWARRNGYRPRLLESLVSARGIGEQPDFWNDFVAVFLREDLHAERFADRILSRHPAYTNGLADGETEFRRHETRTEDHRLLAAARKKKRPWWKQWLR